MVKTRLRVAALIALAALAYSPPAEAQQLGLTLGRFLGDDLLERVPIVGTEGTLSFNDGFMYGGRLIIGAVLVNVEGSVLYSPSSLTLGLDREPVGVRFLYVDGAVLLNLLPGPIAPFLAAGIGWHRISWDVTDIASYSTIGYNVGGGLKFGLLGLGVRADIRDHITPLKVAELDPTLVELLGLEADKTLHNFEISATLLISF